MVSERARGIEARLPEWGQDLWGTLPDPDPGAAAGLQAVWARSAEDIEAAQRLRWQVFAQEMGARLNNCPKYLNTLSIRDNLATTGSLLIDNIRIYRVG